MKFIGFKRVKGYLSAARDFRSGDLFHPAAVFTETIKGNKYTFVIPLTTHRNQSFELNIACDKNGKKIIVDTSTKFDDHRGNIVSEVIIKRGEFQTKPFHFDGFYRYKNASAAIHHALGHNDFLIHDNNSVKSLVTGDKKVMVKKLRDAIQRRFDR